MLKLFCNDSLAGMSANFGLPVLSQCAKTIEQAAEAQWVEALAARITELPLLYACSVAALVQWSAPPAPPALRASEVAS